MVNRESNCFFAGVTSETLRLHRARCATTQTKVLGCQQSSGRSRSAAERATMSTQGDGDHPMDGSTHDATESVGGACLVRRRRLAPTPRVPCRRSNARFVQKSLVFVCHTRIARSRHTEQPLTHPFRASSDHLNRRRRRRGADDPRAHGPALVRAAPVAPAQPPEPPRALGAADAGARVRGRVPGPGALAADGHAHGLPPGPVLAPGEADARPRASHAGLVQRYDRRPTGAHRADRKRPTPRRHPSPPRLTSSVPRIPANPLPAKPAA